MLRAILLSYESNYKANNILFFGLCSLLRIKWKRDVEGALKYCQGFVWNPDSSLTPLSPATLALETAFPLPSSSSPC